MNLASNTGLPFPLYIMAKDDKDLPEVDVAYLLTADGLKLYSKSDIFTVIRDAPTALLASQKTPVIQYTGAKLPKWIIPDTIRLFREVYKKHQSEVVVVFYSDGKDWVLRFPKQQVTSASFNCQYTADDWWWQDGKWVTGDFETWQLMGTAHSHASMPAFASGIDKNEYTKTDGIHLIIGRLNDTPEVKAVLAVAGVMVDVEVKDLLCQEQAPEEPAVDIPWALIDPPGKEVSGGLQSQGFPLARDEYCWDRAYRQMVRSEDPSTDTGAGGFVDKAWQGRDYPQSRPNFPSAEKGVPPQGAMTTPAANLPGDVTSVKASVVASDASDTAEPLTVSRTLTEMEAFQELWDMEDPNALLALFNMLQGIRSSLDVETSPVAVRCLTCMIENIQSMAEDYCLEWPEGDELEDDDTDPKMKSHPRCQDGDEAYNWSMTSGSLSKIMKGK